MMRRALSGLLVCAAAILPAAAHRAPNSLVTLEFAERLMLAEIRVPVSELAYATQEPDVSLYLRDHLAVETPDGKPWSVQVLRVRNVDYQEHAYLVAELELTPPTSAPLRNFVLVNDAITHEVRNHVIWVMSGKGADARLLGALQYPQKRMIVDRSVPGGT